MMSQNNQQANPLSKYFRQPKLYVPLPSGGKYYPAGAIDYPENGEVAIFSMTAKDELLFKTPDALLNGQATVDVIQSCIPAIKDAWNMPSIDLDVCLIAIRLATYGENMTLSIKTPVTGEEKEMQVNLRELLDTFSNVDYSNSVMMPEMQINLRPLSYKEFTQGALKTFEEQRILNIVNDDKITEEDKLQAFTNSFAKLTDLTVDMMTKGIVSIELTQTDENEEPIIVSDHNHILDFVKNADKQFFNRVQKHLEGEREKFAIKPLIAEATPEEIEKGVPTTYEVPITFDQSNFFE
jgi:hypothetical protein